MFLMIRKDASKLRVATIFILLLLNNVIISEILASWMLFRAFDIVSKLHGPWDQFNLVLLKRWTNRRIPSERVSQLHEAWGSLPNL
jgi:hypothetical protein